MNYPEKLTAAADITGSIICMGLDPVPEFLPYPQFPSGKRIISFFETLFGAMKKSGILPGAFKPNLGFYHCLDRPREGNMTGTEALAAVLDMAEDLFPDIPCILDYKRGDIAKSSENYAAEGFSSWGCDAVTAAPYMGSDSVLPFLKQAAAYGCGVYILNRTSNPGAAEFQNLPAGPRGTPLYMKIAEKISEWAAGYPGTGAVAGATSPEELEELARFYTASPVPLLIPGVGGQGGSAADTVDVLKAASYDLSIVRMNSSSGITHPWAKKSPGAAGAPAEWLEICLGELDALNRETGWSKAYG